jgi:PAS domain S-box-containing protein
MGKKLTYEKLEQVNKKLKKEVLAYKKAKNVLQDLLNAKLETLRSSEEKLASVIASVTDHMSMIDEQHNIVWTNDIAKQLFGPDLVGKKCYTAYHGRDKVCDSCIVEKTLANGKNKEHETEVIRADGKRMNFWCTSSVAAWYPDGCPKLVIEVSRDITKRKKAEEALRESERKLRFLSSHLLTAQERERRRISIELHDELGQALMLLKLKLRSVERNLRTDQMEVRQDCEDTLLYIGQVIKNVRRLSRDLSPSILENLGLLAAIRWLIDDCTKYYKVKTSLDMEDINNLFSQEAQIIIYRIFQESLTNIGKHAQATCISVAIKKQDGRVSFVVKDDGKGFDVEQVQGRDCTERGLGLAAMDERAHMLGGFFYIWSQEGKGTKITFTIPVDNKEGSR